MKRAKGLKLEGEDPILALLKQEAELSEETKTPTDIESSTQMVVSELSLNANLD